MNFFPTFSKINAYCIVETEHMFDRYTEIGGKEMETNTYEDIEQALIGYKEATATWDKQEYLRQLLAYITPLIKKKIRHYFGYVDEDLLQLGYVRTIELIDNYEMERNILFMGYMKRMLGCYYYDEKRKQVKAGDLVEYDETFMELDYESGYFDIELEDLLKGLSYKERYVVERHIMEKSLLKNVAQELDLSYVYAKELKRNAIKKLRVLICL